MNKIKVDNIWVYCGYGLTLVALIFSIVLDQITNMSAVPSGDQANLYRGLIAYSFLAIAVCAYAGIKKPTQLIGMILCIILSLFIAGHSYFAQWFSGYPY